VSGMFSKPKMDVAPPTPPPPPNMGNSQGEMDVAARAQAERLQRGRSATMLTGGAGLSDMGSTSKTLLGR